VTATHPLLARMSNGAPVVVLPAGQSVQVLPLRNVPTLLAQP